MKPISFMEMKGVLMKTQTTHKIFIYLTAIMSKQAKARSKRRSIHAPNLTDELTRQKSGL